MTETLFTHGILRTMEESRPRAHSLLVRDGRIAALDDDAVAQASTNATRFDLAGRALVPGFNDAHVHVWKVGQLATMLLDLRAVSSLDELTVRLRTRAATLDAGRFVLGRGLNEMKLREGRLPARADLDAAIPDRPVLLTRTCGHIAVANSRALAAAGVTRETKDPTGGAIDRDVHGDPTGVLRETALALLHAILPKPTAAEYEAMLEAAQERLLAAGVTSATDPGVEPELLAVYRALDERCALRVRLNVMALGLDPNAPSPVAASMPVPVVTPMLRVDSVKFFLDGGLSGGTAALSGRYADGSQGILRLDSAAFHDLARPVHRSGLRIAAHAIGDRAVECALAVFERLRQDGPGMRHRIEHGGLATREQLERVDRGRHPIVAQPIFLREMGPNFRMLLGPETQLSPYPLRAVLDAKCDLALSSDAPVVEALSPLAGIHAAVTRRDREGVQIDASQSISVGEALRAATLGGAIASGDEHDRGSLRVGKRADLVVLDRDPLSVPVEELPTLRVELVVVGGETMAPISGR